MTVSVNVTCIDYFYLCKNILLMKKEASRILFCIIFFSILWMCIWMVVTRGIIDGKNITTYSIPPIVNKVTTLDEDYKIGSYPWYIDEYSSKATTWLRLDTITVSESKVVFDLCGKYMYSCQLKQIISNTKAWLLKKLAR